MKRILCYGDSNTWGTEADGVHLTKESHKLLADKLAKIILSQRIN